MAFIIGRARIAGANRIWRWQMNIRAVAFCALFLGLPSLAAAQPSFTESFFVTANSATTDSDSQLALSRCSRSFADSLTQSGSYIERNSPEVTTTVSGCVEQIADPSTQRACDLAAASASVDYIVMVDALEVSGGWLFEARAVSPAQNGTVWSSDAVVDNQSDFVLAGRQGCRELGQNFICTRTNTCVTQTTAAAERSTLRLQGSFPTVGTVLVDGVEVGNTNQAEFALTPGTKRIEIRAPGFSTVTQTVDMVAGQTVDLANLQLTPMPATAMVRVNVSGATISVAGQHVATSVAGQSVSVNVPTGSSTVRVEAPGYAAREIALASAPGTTVDLNVDLTAGSSNDTTAAVQTTLEPAPLPVLPAAQAEDPDDATLTLYGRRTGRLENGDSTLNSGEFSDSYFYEAYAGETVFLSVSSAEFDTYLMVRGPNEFSLDNDDYDSTTGVDAGAAVTFPVGGEYRVIVTSYEPGESGTYTLSAMPAAPNVPAPTPPRQQTQPAPTPVQQGLVGTQFYSSATARDELNRNDGTLNSGEYRDVYTFVARGGERVSLRANSRAFDTYLMVRGPGDFSLDNDDLDTAAGLNAGMDFGITTPGEYTFTVTSYQPGETGSYELVASINGGAAPAPTPVPARQTIGLAPGMVPATRTTSGSVFGTVDGSALTDGQCRGFYEQDNAIDFSVGQTMNVFAYAESQTDTTMLILTDDNSRFWCDDDSHGNFNPELYVQLAPGMYRVFIGTYSSGTRADYDITLGTR
jgi:hypothetical protein